jgi:hypothetical protein
MTVNEFAAGFLGLAAGCILGTLAAFAGFEEAPPVIGRYAVIAIAPAGALQLDTATGALRVVEVPQP